jgi:hypothetical protein
MGTFRSAKTTLADISEASKKVGGAAEWQTVALVAVAAVAVTALLIATSALVAGRE